MKALLQRVSSAHVSVDQTLISSIGSGVVVFLAVLRGDGQDQAEWLAHKIVRYRMFPSDHRPMDLSLADTNGEALVVPQFTLAARTTKGNRPDFSQAMAPNDAHHLFKHFVNSMQQVHAAVKTGSFQENMQVSLVNDGPVTILLSREPTSDQE
ncbi:MAG: D-aminoacyl-tRNA deacylase [Gammaproteobacteria bacterium]|nr:D-aminoacyl-tRNA deacylase [Gammaproteobacteria bacterium]